MKDLIKEEVKVEIFGKEYPVKELSLAQKIKILGSVGDFIKNIAKNAFFKKQQDGSIVFSFIDEISFADLNIDKIILSCFEVLPELLQKSIPDFMDWDNLPESQSREALLKVLEVNDFKGFIVNFISLATKITR